MYIFNVLGLWHHSIYWISNKKIEFIIKLFILKFYGYILYVNNQNSVKYYPF